MIMSKPNDLTFEVCENKAKDFLDDRRSDAVDKALKRAEKHLNKLLIIVDVQNDFVDGALGTKEATAIIPNIVKKIENWNGDIIATKDTHYDDYLETREGKYLPVPHCIVNTEGHNLNREVDYVLNKVEKYDKNTVLVLRKENRFGTSLLPILIEHKPSMKDVECGYDYIEFVGLCTDICVISNVLIVKAAFPEVDIAVDASCCAGVTPELHKAALDVMKSCQIDIVNERKEESNE
jgi:nicotinamidase-related amidase